MRTGALRAAVLLAVLMVLPGFAAPAGAAENAAEPAGTAPLRLDYTLYAGGLRALEFATRVDLGADDYDVRFQARAAGWIETFFSFALESHAEGVRTETGLSPRRFRTAARWNGGELRWVRLAYPGGETPPRATVVPPPARDDREIVPQAARRGTVDPLSAIYGLLLDTGPEGRCGGTAQVFDGRRRYDITASWRGGARIEGEYSVYSGPAQVCAVRVERVTGFWDDDERRERYPAEIRVFLASVVEGAPRLPVRLEADTSMMALRLHLTAVQRGQAAALPESDLPPVPRDAAARD